MKSPSPESHVASSSAVRSPPRPHIEANPISAEGIASAPFSPCSNKDLEGLVNKDCTEHANDFPTTSGLAATAKTCSSTPALSVNLGTDYDVQAYQPPGVSTDSKKRKQSAIDEQTDTTTSVSLSEQPVSKRSHNAIEKRYRTNLNHKIAALRDAVPSLRKLNAMGADEDGLASSNKFNKATVMSKAIEYIHHLESRNQRLEEENATLRGCARIIEQEDDKVARTQVQAALEIGNDAANLHVIPAAHVMQDLSPASKDPQGMIRVPEEIRRLRQVAPQAHYHGRTTRPPPSTGGIEVYLGAMLRMP